MARVSCDTTSRTEETACEATVVPSDWITLTDVIVVLSTGIIFFLQVGDIDYYWT